MKKILVLILTAAFVLGLAACGGTHAFDWAPEEGATEISEEDPRERF